MTPLGEPATPIRDRHLAARAATLSLEQKVRVLTGADFWSLHPELAIGLRRLVLSERSGALDEVTSAA